MSQYPQGISAFGNIIDHFWFNGSVPIVMVPQERAESESKEK